MNIRPMDGRFQRRIHSWKGRRHIKCPVQKRSTNGCSIMRSDLWRCHFEDHSAAPGRVPETDKREEPLRPFVVSVNCGLNQFQQAIGHMSCFGAFDRLAIVSASGDRTSTEFVIAPMADWCHSARCSRNSSCAVFAWRCFEDPETRARNPTIQRCCFLATKLCQHIRGFYQFKHHWLTGLGDFSSNACSRPIVANGCSGNYSVAMKETASRHCCRNWSVVSMRWTSQPSGGASVRLGP
jgi:hypothetical protein